MPIHIPMPNQLAAAHPSGGGDHVVRLVYGDGAEFHLDLAPLLARESGPLTDPLRAVEEFAKVRCDAGSGALVFPTGYDICPDVLRYWCEVGRVCSQEETDEFFVHAFAQQKIA